MTNSFIKQLIIFMVFKRPVLRHRLLKYSAIKVPDKTFRAQQELERRNVI